MLLQTVTFSIKGQLYGIDILSLDEIIPMVAVNPVPQGPEFLEGVINLRGEVIPIVDLCKQFGLAREQYTLKTRIVIASFHSRKTGFVVDGIKNIMDLNHEAIQPSVVASSEEIGCVQWIAKLDTGRIVHLIAVDKILGEEQLKQLSEIKIEE